MFSTKILSLFSATALIFTACGSATNPFVSNNPSCNYEAKIGTDQLNKLKNYPNNLTMKTAPVSGDTIATIQTNFGDIHMLLYTKEAPETSKNFIELSKQGKYDNTIFHRVIDCFMIQGGDFENRNGTGGYTYKGPGTELKDEFGPGLENVRGAVSMANAGPDTGGSQFFVVQADYGTPWLDGKHAVFGFVYDGMDVVDKIAKVDADNNDKPIKDVVVTKVTVEQFAK